MDGAAKARLREHIRDRRARMSGPELLAAAERLAAHLSAAPAVRAVRCVAAYVPVGSEPGSLALLDTLRLAGTSVLLPLTRAGGELDWAEYGGTLRPGGLGLLEPDGPRLGAAALVRAELVLVPALAADRLGNRLGRGRGYYDRALARLPASTPVVALLHDGEILDVVPAEPHDRPVTAVLTPRLGWQNVGPGSTSEYPMSHHS